MNLEIAKRWDANCKNPATDASHWTAEPIKEALSWLVTEVERLNEADMLAGRALEAKKTDLVDTETALTTLRESITLAAAPLGITGEPGEVVAKMGDEAKRLRGIVTALEDGCYKCQHPVRVRELTCQKNALQQVVSERDEEIASLRAQLLTAREQGRREMREEAAEATRLWLIRYGYYLRADDAADMIRALSLKGEVCQWEQDPTGDPWHTACGTRTRLHPMTGIKHCPYCGKPIHIKEG